MKFHWRMLGKVEFYKWMMGKVKFYGWMLGGKSCSWMLGKGEIFLLLVCFLGTLTITTSSPYPLSSFPLPLHLPHLISSSFSSLSFFSICLLVLLLLLSPPPPLPLSTSPTTTTTHTHTCSNTHPQSTLAVVRKGERQHRERLKGQGDVSTGPTLNGGAVEAVEEGGDGGTVPLPQLLHHLVCCHIFWDVLVVLLLHG